MILLLGQEIKEERENMSLFLQKTTSLKSGCPDISWKSKWNFLVFDIIIELNQTIVTVNLLNTCSQYHNVLTIIYALFFQVVPYAIFQEHCGKLLRSNRHRQS